MLRRYELTDEEWLRIEPLLPPENTGKQGRPRKDNRIIMNGIVWLARSGAPWRDLPERYGSWKTVYSLSLIHICAGNTYLLSCRIPMQDRRSRNPSCSEGFRLLLQDARCSNLCKDCLLYTSRCV